MPVIWLVKAVLCAVSTQTFWWPPSALWMGSRKRARVPSSHNKGDPSLYNLLQAVESRYCLASS
jgi:hypothetical protein